MKNTASWIGPMLETSQTIMRVVALSLFTALFAGLWSGDHPQDSLAVNHKPFVDPIAQMLYPEEQLDTFSQVAAEPLAEVVQVDEVVEHVVEQHSDKMATLQIGGLSKTFSIENEGLQITEEQLQLHLMQLPMGINIGDYRIVDSLGGVGWLRVRGTATTTPASPLISTNVNEQTVQFIKITQTAMK